jgi:hypothetical protein
VFGSIDEKVRIIFGNPKPPQLIPSDELSIQMGPCCFCGEDIVESAVDPCSVNVETSGEKWQVWFCHANCFKERIVKDAEIDLSPAHF